MMRTGIVSGMRASPIYNSNFGKWLALGYLVVTGIYLILTFAYPDMALRCGGYEEPRAFDFGNESCFSHPFDYDDFILSKPIRNPHQDWLDGVIFPIPVLENFDIYSRFHLSRIFGPTIGFSLAENVIYASFDDYLSNRIPIWLFLITFNTLTVFCVGCIVGQIKIIYSLLRKWKFRLTS